MTPTRILRMKSEFMRHGVLVFLCVRHRDMTTLDGGNNPAHVLESLREYVRAARHTGAVGREIRVIALMGDEERELLRMTLVRRRLTTTGPMELVWVPTGGAP